MRFAAIFLIILVVFIASLIIPSVSTLKYSSLEQYTTLHRNNPLFAFEGSDPLVLKRAIENLEKSHNLSLAYLPTESQKYVKKGFYPMEFLKTIPKTEQSRLKLLEHPSIKNALEYHFSLIKTIRTYKKNAEDLINVLSKFENTDIVFINGYTSTSFYIKQLSVAIMGAEKREEDEKNRFLCLLGVKSFCNIKISYLEKNNSKQENIGKTPKKTLLQNKKIVTQAAESSFINPEFLKATETINVLPAVRLPDGSCRYSSVPPVMMFWWSPSRMSDSSIIRITSINDLLFYDLKKAKGVYYETLHEAGIPYQYQFLNPYICPDFGHDAGLVLSSYYVQYNLTEDPVFESVVDNDGIFTKLKTQEELIVSSTLILDSNIVGQFIEEIQFLLEMYSIDELTLLIGEDGVDALYSLVKVWVGKSAWAEYLVGNIDDMVLSTINVSQQQDIGIHALFLTRSYIGTLFFFSNETIVNYPILLTEKEEFVPLENFYLRGYNNDLISEIPPKEASKFIRDSGLEVTLITTPKGFGSHAGSK